MPPAPIAPVISYGPSLVPGFSKRSLAALGISAGGSDAAKTPQLRVSRVVCQQSALLFPGGNFLLQLFKPVQHDVDLRRCRLRLLAGLEHQKALAIGRHVVVAGRCRNWRV